MDTSEINEADLVMISALEHYSYCPRQCALIHVDQTFDENIYTLRGRMLHENAHEEGTEYDDGVRIERSLPLFSRRLGLVGKADVVEFHGDVPYPVEYKHGKKKKWGHAELQLCAQAVCLEEMLGCGVPSGAIFYHGSRRRIEIEFDEKLRAVVEKATYEIRRMMSQSFLPLPLNDKRCDNCSLLNSCIPEVVAATDKIRRIAERLFIPD